MADFNQRPGESAEAYYKRLAKVADQRLVRLEALSYEKGFSNVKDWSYATAMSDIKRYLPAGSPKKAWNEYLRFNTKVKPNDLQDRIVDVRRFLEKPTSNKRDILKFYEKRARKINRSQTVNLTWRELADFFENSKYEKAFLYASGDTLRVYQSVKEGKIYTQKPSEEYTEAELLKIQKETAEERAERMNKELAEALKEGTLSNVIHIDSKDEKKVKSQLINLLNNNKIDPSEVFF